MKLRIYSGKFPARLAGWLVLPLPLYMITPLACAQTATTIDPPAQRVPVAPPSCAVSSAVTMNLLECVQTALHRQPRIAAAHHDLDSAQLGKEAIDNLRLAAVVERDIPIRRRQAALGVTLAGSGIEQAERETVYAVIRTYVTVLYAREQERIAQNVVERLSATHDAAKEQLKAGAKDITASDVNRALVYLRQAQARRVQAAEGEKKAVAALKEAIGLGPEVRLDVPPGGLPDPDLHPSRDEIVALALSRRASMVQASLFVDLTCLEVEAQGSSLLKRLETFAAGADIHSSQVPQGVHDGEYRPGAIPPGMPTLLVGSRADRVKHAEALHARAQAVAEVTRNLLTLEAESAFLRWEETSLQVPPAREAAEAGDKLADDLTRDYNAGLKVKTEEVITARVLAAQSRAQYNEYLFNKILAAAELERVTSGGFCSGLVDKIWAQTGQVTPNSGNK